MPIIRYEDWRLKISERVKYLGVIMDEKIFMSRLDYTMEKIQRVVYGLNRIGINN